MTSLPEPIAPHSSPRGTARLLQDVLRGLTHRTKTVPCKYLYDERGSQLFDQICELPEYYPTPTERAIMERSAREMASRIGPEAVLLELGSGSSLKTRLLLDQLDDLQCYIPLDISESHLLAAADRLRARYPTLSVVPVCGDYSRPFLLPSEIRGARTTIYFPGSTVGNFSPRAARRFLRRMVDLTGPDGGLLIGVDLQKDPQVLHAAYNDASGVTARFNLNLLARLNRELGADFDLEQFAHYAFYNPQYGRIEMHLMSRRRQVVRVGGERVRFRAGETIWTESSYKYSIRQFLRLAATAGYRFRDCWTDERKYFAVFCLAAAAD